MANQSSEFSKPPETTVGAKPKGPNIFKKAAAAIGLAALLHGNPSAASAETITPPQAATPSADQPPVMPLAPGGGAIPDTYASVKKANKTPGASVSVEPESTSSSANPDSDILPLAPGGAELPADLAKPVMPLTPGGASINKTLA